MSAPREVATSAPVTCACALPGCVDPPHNYKRLMRDGGAPAIRDAAQRELGEVAVAAAVASTRRPAAPAAAAAGKRRRGDDDDASDAAVAAVALGTTTRAKARRDGTSASTPSSLFSFSRASSPGAMPVDAVPRFLPPRVPLFVAEHNTAAALAGLPPGLRALLLAAVPPVRDALVPRMSVNSFVSFWRLTWQRLDESSLQSSSPSFFREISYDEPLGYGRVDSLEAQLAGYARAGVAPIPEDALAVLLPAPDTSGVSEVMAAALIEAHEMIVEEYARAAVLACPVPVARVAWFRHSFTPRCNVNNVISTDRFGTSVPGVAKMYATGQSMFWLAPDAVLPMTLAQMRGRAKRLRQYTCKAAVMQPLFDANNDLQGYRRWDATHVVRQEFWSDGSARSYTTYFVDISSTSGPPVPPAVASTATSIVASVMNVPAAHPESLQLAQAAGHMTGFDVLLWQSRMRPHVQPSATVLRQATALTRIPAAVRVPMRTYGAAIFCVNDPGFCDAFVDSILSAQLMECHRLMALRVALQGRPEDIPDLPQQHGECVELLQLMDVFIVLGAGRVVLLAGSDAAALWSAGWTDLHVLLPTQSYIQLRDSLPISSPPPSAHAVESYAHPPFRWSALPIGGRAGASHALQVGEFRNDVASSSMVSQPARPSVYSSLLYHESVEVDDGAAMHAPAAVPVAADCSSQLRVDNGQSGAASVADVDRLTPMLMRALEHVAHRTEVFVSDSSACASVSTHRNSARTDVLYTSRSDAASAFSGDAASLRLPALAAPPRAVQSQAPSQ